MFDGEVAVGQGLADVRADDALRQELKQPALGGLPIVDRFTPALIRVVRAEQDPVISQDVRIQVRDRTVVAVYGGQQV